MHKLNENPLFLFVDDLVNDSSNFASEGKIVELFDTGCDARTPGSAFKTDRLPHANQECCDSTQNNIPNVRKPFSLLLRQDRTSPKKNTNPDPNDDKKTNIIGTREASHLREPGTVNRSKDNLVAKIDGTEVKPERKVSADKQKAKANSTRTLLSSKYGGKTQAKEYGKSEVKSRISRTFAECGKTNSNKSATLPGTASKVFWVKKVVSRAVDKDSLSNCSRQLEMAKTSGASIISRNGYASRLPKSAGAVKLLSKSKNDSVHLKKIESGNTTKNSESKTTLLKNIGDTYQEVRRRSLQSITSRATTIANLRKIGNRQGGEICIVNENSQLVSSRRPESELKTIKLSVTQDFDNQNKTTSVSSKSKITASKVPLPRFGRNSIASAKTVQRTENVDDEVKVDQEAPTRKSKSNEKLSTKIRKTEIARYQKSGIKVPGVGRPATYPEKVPARPSTKSHNLISRESESRNSKISLQETVLPNASVVSKSINQFGIQDRKNNEICTRSPRSLMLSSTAPQVEMRKSKTDAIGKPNIQLINRKLGRFTDPITKNLGSKVSSEHQRKSKADVQSVSLTGVTAVEERDEEVELQNIFDNTSATANSEPVLRSAASSLRANKNSKNSKLQQSPVSSLNGSKVPRLVVEKRFLNNPSPRTSPKKQEPSPPRRAARNAVKTDVKKEVKPSTPRKRKSADDVTKSKDLPETDVATKKETNEVVIPIMNPKFYAVDSYRTRYPKRANLENAVPQKTTHEGKLESWIGGHQQAYLRGRAIGLKVANMARAAKQESKREFVRSGLKSATPISASNKSQEIVDIGVSVIEKVLAEKNNKIHSPSVRGDQYF